VKCGGFLETSNKTNKGDGRPKELPRKERLVMGVLVITVRFRMDEIAAFCFRPC
jgi:hypothetical protein